MNLGYFIFRHIRCYQKKDVTGSNNPGKSNRNSPYPPEVYNLHIPNKGSNLN